MKLQILGRVGSALFALVFLLSAGSIALAQGTAPASPTGTAPATSASAAPTTVGPSATDPVATLNTLLDVVIGRRFDQVASFACAADQATLDKSLDLAANLQANLPAGTDVAGLVDTLTLTIPDRTISLVSNDGSSAVVDVKGTLTVGVDQTALRPWVKQLLVAAGEDSSEAAVDAAMATIVPSLAVAKSIAKTVNLVNSDGAWLICDLAAPSPTP